MPREATGNYIRIRVRQPGSFSRLRTITFSRSRGIKALVGPLARNGKTAVQTLLFEKPKWNLEKAVKWYKEHKDSLKK